MKKILTKKNVTTGLMKNTKNNHIIAFAGRKRSGKTSLAEVLREKEGAVIITIADYLKHLCCEIMGITYEELIQKKDNGYTFDVVPDERWFEIIDKQTNIGIKNIKKELNGKHITNIRELLQVVGTDVIRKYNENWHVEKMVKDIKSQPKDKVIAIDDVRFPNEKRAIEELYGKVFFIVRPNITEVSNHISETALRWQDFNDENVIINAYSTRQHFENEFYAHYQENFQCNEQSEMLLSECKSLNKHRNFGVEADTTDPFFQDLIQQLKNSRLFRKLGIIEYKTYVKEFAERYINEICDNCEDVLKTDNRCNTFITVHPLITENLKLYL